MIVAVIEHSQIGDARRRAVNFARTAALEARAVAVTLVATEMASNLVKHGGGGDLLLQKFDDIDGCGMELIALDRGPGMDNIERSRADGHSTSGTQGTGLGAIARQSDQFHICSRPGIGSALRARFVAAPPATRALASPQLQLGAVVAPHPGEVESGDAWRFMDAGAGPSLLLVDGCGHGTEAARAAATAVSVFESHYNEDCPSILHRIHRALGATRGGAVALARVDVANGLLHYVGVGNIAAALVGAGDTRHLVSINGTAGYGAPHIREFTYELAGAVMLVMHSDGLGTRWSVSAYPGLVAQHPGFVAGVLFRDHRRGRDDASVIALRLARTGWKRS